MTAKATCRFWVQIFTTVVALWLGGLVAPAHSRELIFIPSSPGKSHQRLVDWSKLFEPEAPWEIAASHVDVFGFDVGYLENAADKDIVRVTNDLRRRGIAIAISVPALAYTSLEDCGHGVEGYQYPAEGAAVAKRLKRLGVTPVYIGMDEPLWFGRFEPDPRACHGTVEDVARRAALNVIEYLKEFPDLQIWEGEPVPGLPLQANWEEEYRRFRSEFEHAVGRRVVALDLDVNWRSPDWPNRVIEVGNFAHKLNMKVGVIYNGDGGDATDQAWVAHAIENYGRLESEFGYQPDRAVFAGWNDHPRHVLPETSDSSMTHIIDQYLLPVPTLEAKWAGAVLVGTLTDANRQPVQRARIALDVAYPHGLTKQSELKVSGTIPVDAARAILGLRINTECNCSGRNDILIGDITYQEGDPAVGTRTASLRAREIITHAASGAQIRPGASNGQLVAHVQVESGQALLVNSGMFKVTSGASFILSAPVEVVSGEGIFGGVILIWLDRDGRGLSRTSLGKADKYLEVGSVITGDAGDFTITENTLNGNHRGPIRLRYAGSSALRPVAKIVP